LAEKNTPFVVGLTGQSGAGKTTIAKTFEEEGFVTIICDEVAHKVISSPTVLANLTAHFGSEILNDDGTLNRRMLAAKAFASEAGTTALNNITHPPILDAISEEIDRLFIAGNKYILVDAPTLFESGADAFCDKKVAVLAAEDLRRERIIRRDNLTAEEAARRMSAQKDDSFFKLRCDYCLMNNGTEEQLAKQGKALAESFLGKQKKWKSVWLLVAIAVLSIFLLKIGYEALYKQAYPQKYADAVVAYALEYDLEESLVFAVIKCESGFDPAALSSVGAVGLMQITEDAFEWANMTLKEEREFTSLYEPEVNIRYGCCLLMLLSDKFDDEKTAVTAYHAGQGNVQSWLSDKSLSSDGVTLSKIPFPTTAKYVKRVFEAKAFYEKLYQ